MMILCQDEVYRSYIGIMWADQVMVTYRDYMIGKSSDHDITIAFLLRHKLC